LLGNVFSGRRTVRNYSSDPVALDQLATALHCAHIADLASWPSEHLVGNVLEFRLLAFAVENLDSAVYRYDPACHALARLMKPPTPDQTRQLFLQPEFGSGPVAIFIVGNLAAATALHGAAGYRQLLLRAGVAGHRLWMTMMAMGLSGGLTAGVNAELARHVLDLDGFRAANFLAFVGGRAAKRTRASIMRLE
jgi:nitroreductase